MNALELKPWIGRALTATGERFGVSALVYHRGVMRLYDTFAQRNAPGFSRRLVSVCGIGRYLDVGAGTGRYTEALRELGVDADGCEHSSVGRRQARTRGLAIAGLDLACEPIQAPDIRDYDVALCIEVAEHVPEATGDRLVNYLSLAPTVVFTAAPPGQGGTGHVNEQPRAYWERRFANCGQMPQHELEAAFRDTAGDVPERYLLDNLMIFRRGHDATVTGPSPWHP